MNIRIGNGYDVHKFGGNGPIVLAGVKIPYEQGFVAHSDGDVAIHSLCDAILGALALGDIGKHFPDTADQYDNIDSRILLRHVVKLVNELDFVVGNCDLTIIAEAPKMAPHIENMRKCLAEDLLVDVSQVSVKATTTEKLGFQGRKEGIGVQASVLMFKTKVGTE